MGLPATQNIYLRLKMSQTYVDANLLSCVVPTPQKCHPTLWTSSEP